MEESKKETMIRLLKVGHPNTSLETDEEVFATIIDDYADYARLIEMEQNYEQDIIAAEIRGRNAQIEEQLRQVPPSDGMPHLSGADAYIAANPNSIFAIASL